MDGRWRGRYDITHLNHPGEKEEAEVETARTDVGMRGEEIDRKDSKRKGAQIVKIGELKVVR